ncbi:hypothetical protein ANO11243_008240 [Dothideomycetidae sp. 11243]|nr:hypothetical protein ANO11243_008240 [fungal sp. No.11243]
MPHNTSHDQPAEAGASNPPVIRERLPSIREVFSDHFSSAEDYTPATTHNASDRFGMPFAGPNVGPSLDSMQQMFDSIGHFDFHDETMEVHDSSLSDCDSDASMHTSISPGPRTRQRGSRSPRNKNGRRQNAKSKHTQMVHNRKGRMSENCCLRNLELVNLRMGMCSGNRQIVSNQQKSGLIFTKCSNLETAVWNLLMFLPLREWIARHQPWLLRGLEDYADSVMRQIRRQ